MYPDLPTEIRTLTDALQQAGYQAYLVGGCVRDLVRGEKPHDWDIATDATPEQIQHIFPDSFYENDFGTVGVKTDAQDTSLALVEVTPFRTEGTYADGRRPSSVTFGTSLEEDLARRDFTVNAMALDPRTGELTDPYKGQKDIKDTMLRAVGQATTRFSEDGLRMVRAVRFVGQLGFGLDAETAAAISECAPLLEKISRERIRDELIRILESKNPMLSLVMAQKLRILQHIIPELEETVGVEQNQAHSYDVFEHLLRSMQHAADRRYGFIVTLSALLHDIAKPQTRAWSNEKRDWTFHGHEVVGSRVTRKILENLRFSRETVEIVSTLVRWHMFFSDPDQITLSAVRRMIVNVGREHIEDLLNLRICDRIGTGRPKEQPFRFRKYKAMVEQALRDPVSVSMLEIDGNDLVETFHEKPGPRIGYILHALLEEVLEDPGRNTDDYLTQKVIELQTLPDVELKSLGDAGRSRRDAEEKAQVEEILKRHHVS